MFKRLIILFKLGRKLAKSDALNVISKFNKPPLVVRLLFQLLSFSFSKRNEISGKSSESEKLSVSLGRWVQLLLN